MPNLPTPIFRGRVEAGKICLELREKFAEHVASLDGKPVELILRRERKRRGSAQNRYYWGVVIKLFAEAHGWDGEDLHHELKRRFLAEDPDAALVKTRSTTELSTVEFNDYLEKVCQLAAEMDVYIPAPGEVE
jgi:hypothetical protein